MGSCIVKCRMPSEPRTTLEPTTVTAAPGERLDAARLLNTAKQGGWVNGSHMVPFCGVSSDVTWHPRYGGFLKWRYPHSGMVSNGKSYLNGWFGRTPIPGNLHILRPARLIGCLSSRCVAQRFRLASAPNRCQGAPQTLVTLVVYPPQDT